MDRRQFLRAAAGSATVTGLAGCATLSEPDVPVQTERRQQPRGQQDDPEPAPEPEPADPQTTRERTTQESAPFHLLGASGTTVPDLENSETRQRTYTQDWGWFSSSELTLNIPVALINHYSNRTRIGAYGAYVSDNFDTPYIDEVVSTFKRYGERNGLSDSETINHMISFVQHLEYSTDQVSEGVDEYPKFPVETLVDKGGDCEDSAILGAALLRRFGYGAKLIELPGERHMALGLKGDDSLPGSYYTQNDQRYYYIETTATGWDIGQVPPDIEGASANLLSVDSHPVLVFFFNVSDVSLDGTLRIETAISNVGGQKTNEAGIQIVWETPDGERVARKRSSGHTLEFGQTVQPTIQMASPGNRPLRARVQVALGNTLHDEVVTDVLEPA